MHERYSEPITLKNLAAEVFVSPFHFSRTFSKITGVTPGRYLTAVRIFEAKRLLLTTSLTISNIVCSVGYSSVGTFTSRFTRSVGMTPTQYRAPEVRDLLVAVSPQFQRMPSLELLQEAGGGLIPAQRAGGSIAGKIQMPAEFGPGNVLLGVFADPIPQRGPVAFTHVAADSWATEAFIGNVPAGRWVVIAIAEHPAATTPEERFSIGATRGPITIKEGEVTGLTVQMRRMRPIDPPLAISLGDANTPVRLSPPAPGIAAGDRLLRC
ncbi:helix-turn-helix transcriptional regulator [Saccharothrix sp. ALI-22-I]|uniref:helix-turn-helix transcriptional regulator n=1 Tax=Saccharothrix sp. ALI-22-I TaxID=1933778 RepID=UPI001EE69890|nr:helix-turn-helix transcriptional regulator [Saccharothrix sp. ALI-22-I]